MIIQKTKTGNVAADAIAACLAHYRKFGRRVQYIELDRLWWVLFTDFVKSKDESLVFDDEIQFRNVTIRKGSRLHSQRLIAILEPLKVVAQA